MTPMSAREQCLDASDPPLLLKGEDAAAYDKLLAATTAAVHPGDFIEKIFVADVVYLQWEIRRFRRLKTGLLRIVADEALQSFLHDVLDYALCREWFERPLAEALQEQLTRRKQIAENLRKHGYPAEGDDAAEQENGEDDPEELARRYFEGEPEAVEKVEHLLGDDKIGGLFRTAEANKREELALAYARREADAMKQINELLAANGVTMDDLIAKELALGDRGEGKIDKLELIDRLIGIAEARRSMMLREIDRHRAVLGEALRWKMHELDAENAQVIETTPRKERVRIDK
jgi:hypothetical protein